jgi:hypothetical protein
VWTLDQQAAYAKQGNWPTAGNVNPNAFIENLFSTYLYSGTGASQNIVNGINLSTNGGLVWIKNRTANVQTYNHSLTDTVRGNASRLYSNRDFAANSAGTPNGFTYNSNGFTVGVSDGTVNSASETYASWTFREQPKFFDVVTYTGNSVAGRQISHNLGSVPGVMIVKAVDSTDGWAFYHRSIGNLYYLPLNENGPIVRSDVWNDTTPTSTVFTIGANARTNFLGQTYIAYLFAHDAGGFGLSGSDNVISCGEFATAGSGKMSAPVNLGYEPQWLMVKNYNAAENWVIYDTMRGMSNTGYAALAPNSNAAEFTGTSAIAPNATGFNTPNASGPFANSSAYIYIAIRRGPMAVPTLGTSVFVPNTATYSANQVVTTGFPIDMMMMKGRTITLGNLVYDRLRGIASTNTSVVDAELFTSNSDVEGAGGYINTANNTGYQISPGFSGFSSVNWNFRRAPGFFDEVCYTGTGVNRTIAHNLTVAPELVIIKSRSNAIDWVVGNTSLGFANFLMLNRTDASGSTSSIFNNTAPTSSVFSVGASSGTNEVTLTYVAYLFATCAGVSKVGSYTGTGTTQTINCGFTAGARFVLIKRTDSTGNWNVWDSARGIIPSNDPYLSINLAAVEVTGTDYIDTTSVGFDITSTAPAEINASGGTFIFLAIA